MVLNKRSLLIFIISLLLCESSLYLKQDFNTAYLLILEIIQGILLLRTISFDNNNHKCKLYIFYWLFIFLFDSILYLLVMIINYFKINDYFYSFFVYLLLLVLVNFFFIRLLNLGYIKYIRFITSILLSLLLAFLSTIIRIKLLYNESKYIYSFILFYRFKDSIVYGPLMENTIFYEYLILYQLAKYNWKERSFNKKKIL